MTTCVSVSLSDDPLFLISGFANAEKRYMNRANVSGRKPLASLLASAAAAGLTFVAVLGGGAGCQNDADRQNAAKEQAFLESARSVDAGLVSAVRDSAVKNAIITEHTLYPYHFEPGGVELNELGQRDVAVLAEHFGTHTGALGVRRGGAGDALYNARVDAVKRELARDGVTGDAVRVADENPGGSGMLSDRVRVVLERDRSGESYYDNRKDNSNTVNVNENRSGGDGGGGGGGDSQSGGGTTGGGGTQ